MVLQFLLGVVYFVHNPGDPVWDSYPPDSILQSIF